MNLAWSFLDPSLGTCPKPWEACLGCWSQAPTPASICLHLSQLTNWVCLQAASCQGSACPDCGRLNQLNFVPWQVLWWSLWGLDSWQWSWRHHTSPGLQSHEGHKLLWHFYFGVLATGSQTWSWYIFPSTLYSSLCSLSVWYIIRAPLHMC